MADFKEILERWKRNVLQLDNRNPLINFRPPKQAVEIDTDNPYQVFEDLISNQGLVFDYAIKLGNPFDDEDEDVSIHVEEHDLSSKDENPLDLQRKLGLLRSKDQLWEQEQGLNVLFLTFGCLRWIDDEDEQRRSPLLLLPCDLERLSPRDPFQLLPTEDIPEINETLKVKFKEDFHFDLPEFELGEEDNLPEALLRYLDVLEKTAGYKSNWVTEDSVFLYTFTSSKMAIYRDLNAIQSDGTTHKIVDGFTRFNPGESSKNEAILDPTYSEDYSDLAGAKLDDLLDIKKETAVLDADYSQLLVLDKLRKGENLVVHGPPGTGKSQTIVNMIATCMAEGKSVLFVSEKKAALDVVKRRLAEIKLADLSLDLHSEASKKSNVYDQLKASLDVAMKVPKPAVDLDDLIRQREHLNNYARALHEKKPEIGMSVFDLYGHLSEISEFPEIELPESFLKSVTASKLNNLRSQFSQLEVRSQEYQEHHTSKWRSLQIDEVRLELTREIKQTSEEIRDFFNRCLDNTSETFSGIGLPPPETIEDIKAVRQALQHLQSAPIISKELLENDETEAIKLEADTQLELNSRKDVLTEQLTKIFKGTIPSLNYPETVNRLTVSPHLVSVATRISGKNWESLMITDNSDLSTGLRKIEDLFKGLILTLDKIETLLGLELSNESKINQINSGMYSDLDLPVIEETENADFILNKKIQILKIYLTHISKNGIVPEPWLQEAIGTSTDGTILDNLEKAKESADEIRTLKRLWEELDPFIIEDEISREVLIRYRTSYQNRIGRMVSFQYRKDRNLIKASLRKQKKIDFDQEKELVERIFSLKESEGRWELIQNKLPTIFGSVNVDENSNWDEWIQRYKIFQSLAGLWPNTEKSYQASVMKDPGQSLVTDLINELDEVNALIKEINIPTSGEIVGTPIFRDGDPKATLSDVSALLNVCGEFNDIVLKPMGEFVIPNPKNVDLTYLRTILTQYHELETVNLKIYSTSRYQEFRQDSNGTEAVNTWQGIKTSIDWICEFDDLISHVSDKEPLNSLVHNPIGKDTLQNHTENLLLTEKEHSIFHDKIAKDPIFINAEYLREESVFPSTIAWAEDLLKDVDSVADWATYCSLTREIEESFEFPVVGMLRSLTDQSGETTSILLKRIYTWLIDRYRSKEPVLSNFNFDIHENFRKRFTELDQSVAREKANRIREKVLGNYPTQIRTAATSSGLSLLRNETTKRRRQLPVRLLLRRINDLVKTYKPCYLMSPLAVSQYIELTEGFFDVVIFDEASQVLPEEAIPSIIRSKQVILAGDQKQMPPTIFGRSINNDDEDEEMNEDEYFEKVEDEEASANQFANKESILDVAVGTIGSLFEEARLNVHYRSKDESLIKFSNYQFYNNRLITFPSSNLENTEFGIRAHFVEDGIYDRGKSRRNHKEALRVVDLVFEHMKANPDESIGVAAMSLSQAQHIQDLLDHRRISEDTLDDRFRSDNPEHFFIKNLENVQGDERDRIILSVGYGPTHEGDLKPPNNFGPLSKNGGERRLNVLITRARKKLDVVYSIRPDQIRSSQRGSALLRDFLEYAENPDMVFGTNPITGELAEHDSPLEASIEKALIKRGYKVARQIGASRYRVDLAILSEDESRYDLGIECDGATFHGSPAARDRDWLRQKVLESLGWNISRIWSTSWMNNRGRELERIDRDIEAIRSKSPNDANTTPSEESTIDFNETIQIQPRTSDDLNLKPYRKATLDPVQRWRTIQTETTKFLETQIFNVVKKEGPVHYDIVLERIRDLYGLGALRGGTRNRVITVLDTLIKNKKKYPSDNSGPISKKGGFLHISKRQLTKKARKPPDSNIEHYHPEELKQVVIFAATNVFGVDTDGLITETTRILGYDRSGPRLKKFVGKIIKDLLSKKSLVKDQTGLITVT